MGITEQNEKFLAPFFRTFSHNKRPLLLLDYDGTIAPFHTNPLEAYPYPGVRECLERLMHSKKSEVIIVSGRNLKEILPLLNLNPHPEIWGSHGWEYYSKNGDYISFPLPKTMKVGLHEAYIFAHKTPYYNHLEVKPFSLALHWRGCNEETIDHMRSVIIPEWNSLTQGYLLELHSFDGGIELRAQGRGKGDVITTIISEGHTFEPIAYLGDDYTDEDAFASLKERGLKVLVREVERETLADIRIVPPNGLIQFLQRWIEAEKNI